MARAPHRSHRYRVVSRCVGCGVRMLGACSYRTCPTTTVYPIRHRDACPYPWVPRPARVRVYHPDMIAIARRIFGADLIDTLPLEDMSDA